MLRVGAKMSVGTDVMKLAKAAMLEQLKESRWYQTAPAAARQLEPVIELTGIELRKVFLSIGILPAGAVEKPFLVGKVTVGGISARLALRLDFGNGGLAVDEYTE